ncbi:hypothetical protein V5O48_003853 [Marasmius crinis-equi]|uniref:Coilin n=1 Tax=Marasmius crinis-equi TaxID=585013 RepID=A0ABR3FRQ7_9AGAR
MEAWFSSSQPQYNLSTHPSQYKPHKSTISDLKNSICSTIKPVSEGGFNADEIILELDGFELLDEFTVDELIREGDLLLVGLKQGVSRLENTDGRPVDLPVQMVDSGKKRKMEVDFVQTSQAGPSKKRRKRRESPSSSESSSASSSSSSEPSSSSDSSSSESSSSDSESASSSNDSDGDSSDSDASISSSSAPSEAPIKLKQSSQQRTSKKPHEPQSVEKHVAPGQGSAQTRKRNLRRKLKRQHDIAAARGEELIPPPQVPKGLSEANIAPLGSRPGPTGAFAAPSQPGTPGDLPPVKHSQELVEPDQQLVLASPQPFMDPSRDANLNISMFSLGNKNKKKGFKKQALGFPSIVGKIVFQPEANLSDAAQVSSTVTSAAVAQEPVLPFTTAPIPQPRPRLVPPSEKESLGLLPRNIFVTSVDAEEGLTKKKKKQRGNRTVDDSSYAESSSKVSRDAFVSCQREEEEVVDTLNYGDAVEELTLEAAGDGDREEDTKAKLLWTIAEQSFDSLSPIVQEDKGGVIHAGVVVGWKALALNPITYSPEILLHLATVLACSPTSVTIRRIVRPEWEEAAEEEDNESVAWDRAVEDGWRVVKT